VFSNGTAKIFLTELLNFPGRMELLKFLRKLIADRKLEISWQTRKNQTSLKGKPTPRDKVMPFQPIGFFSTVSMRAFHLIYESLSIAFLYLTTLKRDACGESVKSNW